MAGVYYYQGMKPIMKLCRAAFWLIILMAVASCAQDEGDQAPMLIFTQDFDFNNSEHGWGHGFADYPSNPEDSTLYELRYVYTDQPLDSKLTKRSLMLSGKNLNHDLFMYLKRKVNGLRPDTDYIITFNVELASNLDISQYNSAGSVFLKAGATHTEPKSVIESGYYIMNIDKGNQNVAGEDMISLGDILTSGSGSSGYTLISRNNAMGSLRYEARTNSRGELWLIIGTDSSLEGTTTLFYSRINVVFSVS